MIKAIVEELLDKELEAIETLEPGCLVEVMRCRKAGKGSKLVWLVKLCDTPAGSEAFRFRKGYGNTILEAHRAAQEGGR